MPEVYAAKCQILLKSKETYDYQDKILGGLGATSAYASYSQTASQMNVMKSSDLIEQVLDRLSLEVSYFIIGRLKTTEVYRHMPFKVELDAFSKVSSGASFYLQVLNKDHFELSYEIDGQSKIAIYPFNELILDDGLMIKVLKQGNLTEESVEEVKNVDYLFKVYRQGDLIYRIKNNMEVENLEYTSIVELTLSDNLPQRAVDVLFELSELYVESTVQNQLDINENTIEYIDRQLVEVTDIISEIEREMEDYRSEKAILDLNYETENFFNSLTRLDTEKESVKLQIRTIEELTEYILRNDQVESLLPPSAVFIHSDDFISSKVQTLYDLRNNYQTLVISGTRDNPLIDLELTKMKDLKEDLLRYIQDQKAELNKRLVEIDDEIENTKFDIRRLPKTQRQMMNIERRIKVNENLYSFLLSRRAEAVIAKAGLVPETKVIERPRSVGVVAPDKIKIQLMSTVIALLVAAAVVVIRELFFQKIKMQGQLQSYTNLPILGGIPRSSIKDEFILSEGSKDSVSQAFRVIRTNLQYMLNEESESGAIKVLVTSLLPSEGKTFVTINTAAILAFAGKKVLILDFDLHKPRLAKAIGMENKVGISSVLSGQANAQDVIQRSYIENMDIVTSGPIPPNPSELILGKRFEEMFEAFEAQYDFILFDTPPISLISDGVVLMESVDVKLFVLNSRSSTKVSVDYIEELRESKELTNVGLVLNEERVSKLSYFYSKYGYGYGYGYGYSYGYKYEES